MATHLPRDSKVDTPNPGTQNLSARCHHEGGNAGRPARCSETEGKLFYITCGDQPLQTLFKRELQAHQHTPHKDIHHKFPLQIHPKKYFSDQEDVCIQGEREGFIPQQV